MSDIILDASALIALIANEKGADIVTKYLPNAVMSTVNITEVITRIIKAGASFDEAQIIVDSLIHTKVSFTDQQAMLAGKIVTDTKKHNLSLGDRACLALAMNKELPVLTADKVWSKLKIGVKVEQIR